MDDTKKPLFIMVTKEYSGLGFAKLIADAGYQCVIAYELDPELEDAGPYKKAGKGIAGIRKVPLAKIFEQRDKFKEAYWFFDQNNHNDIGQILHDEGFKVWGGSELCGKMEHDRAFGIDIAKKAGVNAPEEFEFYTLGEGIAHLQENAECAYVFKPNEPDDHWETFVPDSERDHKANQELMLYMEALPEGNLGGYILQERKNGVEINMEIWVRKGVPFFALCELECKKKLNDDLGPLVGGAQDINFTVPIDCKGIRDTVGKLLELPEYKDYTGFLDMNVIVAEKDNYFLEFCARFGYPEHPTVFSALAKDPFPEILMDMIDGSEGDFYEHFKFGFGAGITLYTDKDGKDMALSIEEEVDRYFYPFDEYLNGDIPMSAGIKPGIDVGIITGHGYTIKQAADTVLMHMSKIKFPNRGGRTDIDENDYGSAPQGRYDALVAMHYLTRPEGGTLES